jgi:hypothetical protein
LEVPDDALKISGTTNDEIAERRFARFSVIPANPGSSPGRKPESSKFNLFWMPDQVRHDDSWTSCEVISNDEPTVE